MFDKSAEVYDLIYRSLKNYAEEAIRLDYLFRHFDPPPATILDVGCGTGEHARQLGELGYTVDGVDIEPQFIALASAKNPGGVFKRADMADFDLGKRYDVALCLFSSIAYVVTKERLQASIRCMAGHLKPGGILIIEPWIEPETDTERLNDELDCSDPTTGFRLRRIRKMNTEGRVNRIAIDYIAEPSGQAPIRFSEEHRLGLFTQAETLEAFQQARLAAQYVEPGLHNKGIYVAKK